MKGKLYALGIGPGDPDLITLKALNILKKANLLIAIRTDQELESKVRPVISPHLDSLEDKYYEQLVPTKGRCQNFFDCWMELAKKINRSLDRGEDVAFLIPEDPATFSIFTYLADIMEEEYGEYNLEIVPGINSLSYIASNFKMPLVMENERLAILHRPSDLENLPNLVESFDTLAILKGQGQLKAIKEKIKELDLSSKTYFFVSTEEEGHYTLFKIEELEDKGGEGDLFVIIKN